MSALFFSFSDPGRFRQRRQRERERDGNRKREEAGGREKGRKTKTWGEISEREFFFFFFLRKEQQKKTKKIKKNQVLAFAFSPFGSLVQPKPSSSL